MAQKLPDISGALNWDSIAFVLSLFYVQSVLTVAHHTSMWIHNGSSHTVESPAWAYLAISLLLTGYSWRKHKGISIVAIITLTVLATSSLFWLSGLRTNFYF